MDRDYNVAFSMTGNLEIITPTFTSNLKVNNDASINFFLLQEVFWKISFGYSYVGVEIFAKFRTPLLTQYSYAFDFSGEMRRKLASACYSGKTFSLAITPDAIGLSVGTFSPQYPISFALNYKTLYSSTANICFASADSANTVSPTQSPSRIPTLVPTKSPSTPSTSTPPCFTVSLRDSFGDGEYLRFPFSE